MMNRSFKLHPYGYSEHRGNSLHIGRSRVFEHCLTLRNIRLFSDDEFLDEINQHLAEYDRSLRDFKDSEAQAQQDLRQLLEFKDINVKEFLRAQDRILLNYFPNWNLPGNQTFPGEKVLSRLREFKLNGIEVSPGGILHQILLARSEGRRPPFDKQGTNFYEGIGPWRTWLEAQEGFEEFTRDHRISLQTKFDIQNEFCSSLIEANRSLTVALTTLELHHSKAADKKYQRYANESMFGSGPQAEGDEDEPLHGFWNRPEDLKSPQTTL